MTKDNLCAHDTYWEKPLRWVNIPIQACGTQQGHDFGTPDLERGIHIQDFSKTGY